MNKGFSLVEILIVVAILAILILTMVGILNPAVLVNRANDATKKKDMGRIKVAFEEYYNDKGCYPTDGQINNTYHLRDVNSCDMGVFSPWLSSWPCDPTNKPYIISVEETDCPKWFKIFTKLLNENDTDIPAGWNLSYKHLGNGEVSWLEVNYGTSSTNVNWYDFVLSGDCETTSECYGQPAGPGSCQPAGQSCNGANCYIDHNCNPNCRVGCCNGGVVCGI